MPHFAFSVRNSMYYFWWTSVLIATTESFLGDAIIIKCSRKRFDFLLLTKSLTVLLRITSNLVTSTTRDSVEVVCIVRRAQLVSEKQPILIGRTIYPERSNGCYSVRATGGSLHVRRYSLILFTRNKERNSVPDQHSVYPDG